MLEQILQLLGSKHPIRTNPICIADNEKYGDGYTKYEWLTKSGWEAYEKLIAIIYQLNKMGILTDTAVEDVIETLDNIISTDIY